MSRVIKFRAWDGKKIIMNAVQVKRMPAQSAAENDFGLDFPAYCTPSFTSCTMLDVMQFTGLHDVNGVEIYEGDIVVKPDQYIWFDDGEPNYVGVVEMTFSAWSAVAHCVNPEKHGISNGMNFELNECGFADGENTDWQIIGNIYQNPELLK